MLQATLFFAPEVGLLPGYLSPQTATVVFGKIETESDCSTLLVILEEALHLHELTNAACSDRTKEVEKYHLEG
jgi:hypothetical protein